MTSLPQIGIWLLSTVFSAGVAWAAFGRMRKDINAIGRIQRRDRWNAMLTTMVITEERKDREAIAALMREL
jgi:hypothetical protein